MNGVQCFYAVKIAILATATFFNFQPTCILKATNNLANAAIRQACFSSDTADRWPTLTFIICIICKSQQNKSFRLIFWTTIPDD